MKRIIPLLIVCMATLHSNAMSYAEAQQRAWFLTDKMAYELDLTTEQCERAYEINMDYMLNIATPGDAYGPYWTYRNADFRCVLFDWQYIRFTSIAYFYRPLRWMSHGWYCLFYDHYRHDHYYFKRPVFVSVYRGRSYGHVRHYSSPYRNMSFRRDPGLRARYYTDRHPSTHGGGSVHMGRNGQFEWRNNSGPRVSAPDNNRRPDHSTAPGRSDRPTFHIGNTPQAPGHNATRPEGVNRPSQSTPQRGQNMTRPVQNNREMVQTPSAQHRPSMRTSQPGQRETSVRHSTSERRNTAPAGRTSTRQNDRNDRRSR